MSENKSQAKNSTPNFNFSDMTEMWGKWNALGQEFIKQQQTNESKERQQVGSDFLTDSVVSGLQSAWKKWDSLANKFIDTNSQSEKVNIWVDVETNETDDISKNTVIDDNSEVRPILVGDHIRVSFEGIVTHISEETGEVFILHEGELKSFPSTAAEIIFPDEPEGLGAVVEIEGKQFVRMHPNVECSWYAPSEGGRYSWNDICQHGNPLICSVGVSS